MTMFLLGCSLPVQWAQTDRKTDSAKEGRTIASFALIPLTKDEAPELDKNVLARPSRVKVDGLDVEISANTKAKFDLNTEENIHEKTATSEEIKMQEQKNTGLIVWGILITIAGIAVVYFGFTKIGLLAMLAGASLIVTVYYPWIWLIGAVALLAIAGLTLFGVINKDKLNESYHDALVAVVTSVSKVNDAAAAAIKEKIVEITGSKNPEIKDTITEIKKEI